MDKNTFFTGQPIFTQLLKFIPRDKVQRLAHHYQADRYYKRFKSYEHLVTMLYTCFHGCRSLREVTTGVQVCFNKLTHLLNYSSSVSNKIIRFATSLEIVKMQYESRSGVRLLLTY